MGADRQRHVPATLFPPARERDQVPIVQEVVGPPGPVWTGAGNLAGTRYPDRPALVFYVGSIYRFLHRNVCAFGNIKKLDVNMYWAVGAWSKAWVCDRSLAGIGGSSPAGGIDVCLL